MLKRNIHLYGRFIAVQLKSIMQYKISFLLTSIGQFLVSFNVFLGIYFMFQRFHMVKDFQYNEIILCFSIVLMSFTIAECFFRGFDTFASMIGNGEFDRILVRPKNEIFLVLSSKIELTRMGRFLQAIVMMVYALPRSGIHWNTSKIFTLISMIIGGVTVFAGLFLIYAALCFFTLEGLEFMNIFTDGAREFGKYPLSVYGKNVLKFCTYIIPFALFQYYPFLYLIGRSRNPFYPFLPFTTLFFLIACYFIWRFGLKHYKSTGS